MTTSPRSLWLRHLVLAVVLILSPGMSLTAQVVRKADVFRQQVAEPPQHFILHDTTFDQWAFGNGRSEETIRRRLETALGLRVDQVARACELTDAQKAKLQLAGRGDIKRLFDQVEEKRRKYVNTQHDRARIQEILQEIQPLQVALNSEPFGASSLFAKTLRKALSGDQAARYEEALREKQRYRHRAKIELVVVMLNDAVGFTAEQRRKLVNLLLAETRPPRISSRYDYQVLLLQAAKLPQDKLRPLFDENQWLLLSRQFDQARQMEPILRRNGFLPEGAADAEPKARPIP